jgi:DNA-binding NarL/FixJ family response regulator
MKQTAPLKVSIVEDDTTIRETLRSLFLFEEGMEAFTVHSTAEDALLRLRENCPDVVIMDINLPGASGIDCVRQMSQYCQRSQFLMYTVHDDDHRVFEALKAGANGYILKSSTPDEIIAAVRELIDGGSPMSAHVARRVVTQLRPVKQEREGGDNLLSTRENEVLALLAEGLLYKEIGERLRSSSTSIASMIRCTCRTVRRQ